MKRVSIYTTLLVVLSAVTAVFAQEAPPAPSAPKTVTVPAVSEAHLPNGLTIATVEKNAVPLVTIYLLVKAGANAEPADKAGLADMTASMLEKGTKTRSATEIAEAVEFLGGSINSGAGWNNSFVSITVTSDKIDQAMAILADVVLNPKFDQKEIDLLKTQTLDELTGSLKQPGFLASYVASKHSFGEHPAGGTPASIASITAADVNKFYSANYDAAHSVLIFAGNISAEAASAVGLKYFGKAPKREVVNGPVEVEPESPTPASPDGILVIDLPRSGQAAVAFTEKLEKTGRRGTDFYTASVLNSVVGGGYSARLNYEIRIKRGLSYGASSRFSWRNADSNFFASAQTKNESAAEVAELLLGEIRRLSSSDIANSEMVPRKSVLTGGFGRSLETTAGLAGAIADLYAFGIPTSELNQYVNKINSTTPGNVKEFSAANLTGSMIVIAGDYSVFKDDLAKRFPKAKVQVIKAAELDLSKDTLQK